MVGTGQNMPISPDVLARSWPGGIEEIADRPRDAAGGVHRIIGAASRGRNQVTPDGQVPDLDQLALSVENLRRRIGA